MSIQSINPANGEVIQSFPEMSSTEVDGILEKAHQAFLAWRETGFPERAAKMKQAADILRKNKEAYARLMAQEMGKPLAQGRGEAEKCAWVCDYYAEKAAQFLAPEPMQTDASKSFVAYQPLGVAQSEAQIILHKLKAAEKVEVESALEFLQGRSQDVSP